MGNSDKTRPKLGIDRKLHSKELDNLGISGRASLNDIRIEKSYPESGQLNSAVPETRSSDKTKYFEKYLRFKNSDIEHEYISIYTKDNAEKWQTSVWVLFVSTTALYIYWIWYNQSNITGSREVCSNCKNNYDMLLDVVMWASTVVLPFAVNIGCKKGIPGFYRAYTTQLISFACFSTVSGGIGVRSIIIESQYHFMETSFLMSIMLLGFVHYTKLRIFYAKYLHFSVLAFWVIVNATFLMGSGQSITDPGKFGIGLVCFVASSYFSISICQEIETNSRIQFIMDKATQKNHAKIQNQLNLLARSYSEQPVNKIESPLEKSIFMVRAMMADSSIASRHLKILSQVVSLLLSSNLLSPDFENTAVDNMDNEQKAWLLNEVASKRRQKRLLKTKASFSTKGSISSKRPPSFLLNNQIEEEKNPNPAKTDEIQKLLQESKSYDFNIFELHLLTDGKSLTFYSREVFVNANLFETFNIPIDKFDHFLNAIEAGYHQELPCNQDYLILDHNSLHATDVLHCLHHLSSKLDHACSDMETLAMYFAAIIHDHDHPGVTSNFLVATSDPKAILYNDQAVLENHHVASSFLVLHRPENNFLSHFSKKDYKIFREIVIELVLATNLGQHFNLLSLFKSKITGGNSFDPVENAEDRMLMLKIAIKCSDVSNPTKPLYIYKQWAKRILEEFLIQGDIERQNNIPISPYMDRENSNAAGCQIGFIDYVVQPLFAAFDSYIRIPSIMENLNSNREYWGNLKLQGVTTIPE